MLSIYWIHLGENMRQIWISAAGEPEVLEVVEAPDPIPQTGEVRIRVETCGVNFNDILGRMGIYRDAPRIPYVPGYEVAGVVDMVGQGVPDIREDDKVFATTRLGGYSDMVCVPYKQVFKRMDWMSPADAGALAFNYLTAYLMLIIMGSLRAGDKVLIHGVAGGVGLAALDYCRIIGGETFGTASPHKHEFLQERGLNHAIDYRNQDYERIVEDLTGGKGVNLILDPLGGKHWAKNYRLLTPTGRLIQYGNSSAATGKRKTLVDSIKTLLRMPFYTPFKLMNDNKGVIGINLDRLWNHAELQREWMSQILDWYDEALFRPHIDQVFKFSQAANAHHYVQDRKNIGKVLLVP